MGATKSRKPARLGKLRDAGPGRKGWRVTAYAPTAAKPLGRVKFKDPEKTHLPPEKQWSTRTPEPGQTLDELFDVVESALDHRVSLSPVTVDGTRRDMKALAARYVRWLESQGRMEATIRKVEDLIDTWVLGKYGDLLVADWSSEVSAAIIDAAKHKPLSPSRVEDLGSALSGMRKTAWRKTAGGAWLSRTDDPLEDVKYSRGATIHHAHRDYVEERQRPTTQMVRTAVAACAVIGKESGAPTLDLMAGAAGFCGPRLGEQLGLRAIDVDLRDGELDVNGSWVWPRRRRNGLKPAPHRAPIKTKQRRRTPYPASLHDALVRRCAEALGLPDGASEELVVAAIDAERERRAALDPRGEWRFVHVPPTEECWLFPNPKTSMPFTKERHNELWRAARDLTAEMAAADPKRYEAWPASIKYRNMRHHCATWMKNTKGLKFTWEEIALFLGNSHVTLQNYYVLTGEDTRPKARKKLRKF